MKVYFLKYITVLAAVALAFAPVRAEFTENDCDDDNERGGEVEGTEELEQKVRLTPTAEAPEGARGKAELEAENENGATVARLEVDTKGLVLGTYTVTAISLSTGTATQLGTFEVKQNEDGDDDDQGEDSDDDDDGGAQASSIESDDDDDQEDDNDQGECGTSGRGEFGSGTTFEFPAGFNPLDIAALEIADASGVVVLRGDFTNLGKGSRCKLNFNVQITPGAAAPVAAGSAELRVRASRRAHRQMFRLKAQNVPAGTELALKVNGQAAGTVRTNRKGGVTLHRLPRGISGHRVHSVSFDDANGANVLKARF
jgi:hypothetical protein